jgi:hypothetical protein
MRKAEGTVWEGGDWILIPGVRNVPVEIASNEGKAGGHPSINPVSPHGDACSNVLAYESCEFLAMFEEARKYGKG